MIRIIYSVGGKEIVFKGASASAVIGRPKLGTTCDFDLSHDTKVSRPHARISSDSDRYWVEDLNSKHGTKINGQEIKGQGKRELREGDSVAIGNTNLRIEKLNTSGAPGEFSGANHNSVLPRNMRQVE